MKRFLQRFLRINPTICLGLMIGLIVILTIGSETTIQAMTIISVNDTGTAISNDGKCTLIEAIEAANSNKSSGNKPGECPAGTDDDIIRLAEGAVYRLTESQTNSDGPTGLPSIIGKITIEGEGATIERSNLANTPNFRLFHIDSQGDLTLEAVNLTNGQILAEDSGFQHGGAIFNRGTLTIINSALFDNQTLGDAGEDGSSTGAGGGGGGGGGFGGALFNDDGGIVSIINSTFSGNQVVGGAGGQGFSSGGAASGAGGDGGGPGGQGGPPGLPGTAGQFGGGGGGGSGVREIGSDGGNGGDGGGGGGGGGGEIGGFGGIGNSGGGDGGQNQSGGAAGGGGGAGLGGAIFNNGGTISLENVTIADNRAIGGLGGSGASGEGDGEDGLGIGDGIYNHTGLMSIGNTIIANSASAEDCAIGNGTIESRGYNLIGDDSCNRSFTDTTDLNATDPLIGPLQDNGGGTLTHALLPDSPAIDHITDPSSCLVEIDQRGIARPVGNFCDSGAYEAELGTITLRLVVVGSPSLNPWRFLLNNTPLPSSIPPTGGSLTLSATAGLHTLTALPQEGYTIVSQCDGELTGNTEISFQLPANGRIVCTFTATAQSSTLILTKEIEGQTPADNWEFLVDGNLFTIPSSGGSQTIPVEPGLLTIKENVKPGYSFEVDCTNNATGGNAVTLDLEPGERVECVFSSVRQIDSITIIKQTLIGTTEQFGFEGDLGTFVLGDGGAYTQSDLTSGVYTVSEMQTQLPDPSWVLLSVQCKYEQDGDLISLSPPVEMTDVSFDVNLPFETGQDLVCIFHNERSTFEGDEENFIYLPILLK